MGNAVAGVAPKTISPARPGGAAGFLAGKGPALKAAGGEKQAFKKALVDASTAKPQGDRPTENAVAPDARSAPESVRDAAGGARADTRSRSARPSTRRGARAGESAAGAEAGAGAEAETTESADEASALSAVALPVIEGEIAADEIEAAVDGRSAVAEAATAGVEAGLVDPGFVVRSDAALARDVEPGQLEPSARVTVESRAAAAAPIAPRAAGTGASEVPGNGGGGEVAGESGEIELSPAIASPEGTELVSEDELDAVLAAVGRSSDGAEVKDSGLHDPATAAADTNVDVTPAQNAAPSGQGRTALPVKENADVAARAVEPVAIDTGDAGHSSIRDAGQSGPESQFQSQLHAALGEQGGVQSPKHDVRPAGAAPVPVVSAESRFVESNHANIITGIRGDLLPQGGTMHIRLDPPELGALAVSISVKDGVVTAAFETSNAEATRALTHSLAQLKSGLESAGVTVERLHVQQAADASPSRNDSNARDDRQQQQQQGGAASEDASGRQEQQRREMLRRLWAKINGGFDPVDLVA